MYLNKGYNQFLTREKFAPSLVEFDPLQTEQLTPDIPIEKLTSGIMRSLSQKFTLDLDGNMMRFHDGARTRVEIGELIDGYGIKIYDKDGDVVMNITDTRFISGAALDDASITASKLNLADFATFSSEATVDSIAIPDSSTITVTMTLTLNVNQLTLAIPRWSFYDNGIISEANELEEVTNEWQELWNFLSWQQTNNTPGSEFVHEYVSSVVNFSGGSRNIAGKGVWIFLGEELI